MKVNKSEVYDYIKSMVGVDINDNTRFFYGVGIDGLDAWSFIEMIEEKYATDFTGYNWEEYHISEADLFNTFKIIFMRNRPTKDFTALQLYHVIKAGKWFEPPK